MKRTLSFLLALAMLLSIIPMTALSTAAITDDEVTATGETYGVSTGEALFAMLEKDTPAGDVMTINVNSDISYYVTAQGVTGIDSYLRYACTVGKGRKILNLNGHTLHFYNDYVVIDACNGYNSSVINNLNRQCLFEIPDGADLTVNGDKSGSIDSGLIQYHGKLLNKCDAVDQRDIFEIRGGSLTINSGRYLAGGEVTSYEWQSSIDILPGVYVPTDEKAWYLVGGDAIRAMAGSLTINGGYFEGRGLSGYSSNRNEVIYASVDMSSVVINDGHFNGRSGADAVWAETLINAGRFTVNGGIFELDKNAATIGVVYRSYTYATSDSGIIGVSFPNASPNTLYYYKEKSNSNYIEAPYDSVKSDEYSYFRLSKVYQVYVEPKQGHRTDSGLSIDPTGDIGFLVGGKKYNTSDDINWRVGNSMKLYIDPDSLYFADQKASAYGVAQSLSSTVRFDLIEYISDGNQPVVLQNQSAALSKDSDGNYYIDLNSLSTTVKNKLAENKTYCFKFTVTENWKSRREFNIWHTGRFYVTISQSVKQIFCQIDEPVYGKKATTNVYYDYSKDWCEVNFVSWTYKTSESDSFHSMSDSDYFTRDKIYYANFIVNMKSGYTLADNADFFVDGEKATISYQNEGGLIAYKEFDMRAEPIRSIAIMNVPTPVAGETPIYSCDYPRGYYYIDTQMHMDWCDEYGFRMLKTDTFEGGKDYIVEFHITTDNGYKFADNVGATVNGYKANVTESWTDTYGTGHARVQYTFTCPVTVTTIGALSVTVPLPEAGKALGYTASVPEGFGYEVEDYGDGSDWKDGVKWVDSNGNNLPIGTKAEAGKSYTAWVSLEINDTDLYQFAPADEVTAYMNDKDAEVNEYDEYNYGVYCTFTVGESSGGYIIGDADTDRKITILDATAIQRKLASLSVEKFDEDAADADEDTKLTILDATAIQRHLAALPTNPNIGKEKA